MNYKLFDLHCDTAHELKTRGVPLRDGALHINLDGVTAEKYAQVTAIWSPKEMSDEDCWDSFFSTLENLRTEAEKNSGRIAICSDYSEITFALSAGKLAAIPAVEDARLLAGKLERVDLLRRAGVRFMTLLWSGETIIGGSFDTDLPLTGFGRDVVRRMLDVGIIPDVSHASPAAADEIASLAEQAGKPFVATHSNSRAVFDHPRNLPPALLGRLIRAKGVVGISLCTPHICDCTKEVCGIPQVLRHIDDYLSRGAEKVLCLGCDFDGIDTTPEGLENNGRLYALAEAMLRAGYPQSTVDDVFFGNARHFAERNL